jgi:hypothetical protein
MFLCGGVQAGLTRWYPPRETLPKPLRTAVPPLHLRRIPLRSHCIRPHGDLLLTPNPPRTHREPTAALFRTTANGPGTDCGAP